MSVSKTIANPKKSTTSWRRSFILSRYVLGLDIDPEEAREQGLEVDGVKCIAFDTNGFIGKTPEHFVYEMQVLSQAARQSSDPIHHQVLSVEETETISTDQFPEIVAEYIDFYRFHDHQVIAGLHDDTDNRHIHLVVNRYNLETDRTVSINGGFDRNLGALFCCHLEHKFGYSPSPEAAAYRISDQYVLSDFYNTNSAAGHITSRETRYGSTAERTHILQHARSAMETSRSWEQYLTTLHEVGISVRPGNRGGLVYARESEGKTTHVAASRLSRDAMRPALDARFAAPFPETFEPKARSAVKRGIDKVDAKRRQVFASQDSPAPTPRRARYSAPPTGTPSERTGALEASISQTITTLGSGHVLFERPLGSGTGPASRVHVLDRARGDASPLSVEELHALKGNIAHVIATQETVRLLPENEAIVCFEGPADALQALQTRGALPVITQPRAGGVRVFFTGLETLPKTADAQQWLARTLSESGLARVASPDILLGRNGRPAPLTQAQTPPFPMLAPPRMQLPGLVREQITALTTACRRLPQDLARRLKTRLAADRFLNAFKAAPLPPPGDTDHDQRDRARGHATGFQSAGPPAGSLAGRSLQSHPSTGGPGASERRGEPLTGKVGRGPSRTPGGDLPTDRGDGDHVEQPHRDAGDGRKDTGKHAKDPQDRVAAASNPEQRPRAVTPSGPAWRMLHAMRDATAHGYAAKWSGTAGQSDVVITGQTRPGSDTPLLRISDTAIHLTDRNVPTPAMSLVEALHARLSLPVERPPAPTPPQAPVTGPKPPTPEPSHKSPFSAAQPGHDLVRPTLFISAARPAPEPHPIAPHTLIFDPHRLRKHAGTEDGVHLLHDRRDLDALDLSALTHVIHHVPSMLADDLDTQMQDFQEVLAEQNAPEIDRTTLQVRTDEEPLAPQTLVIVFDPPEDLVMARLEDDTLIVPVSPEGTLLCDDLTVDFTELRTIALHRELPAEALDTAKFAEQCDAVETRLITRIHHAADQPDQIPDFSVYEGELEETQETLRRLNDPEDTPGF